MKTKILSLFTALTLLFTFSFATQANAQQGRYRNHQEQRGYNDGYGDYHQKNHKHFKHHRKHQKMKRMHQKERAYKATIREQRRIIREQRRALAFEKMHRREMRHRH
ncbi:MAG TPA: hypothetical protein PKX92_00850 [Edaphocola sp.]|nr:hypothetical protein [Edaphocola sp.]